jgi:acetyl-CoA carboxylase biotin carboxyl carrier protein
MGKAVELLSDVTGSVWKVLLSPGATVQADEPILLVESMKMEIPLVSEKPGRLIEVRVNEGDAVVEGQTLAIIEI